LRGDRGDRGTPLMALIVDDGVRNPFRLGLDGGATRGDSDRGRDGRLSRGLGAVGGPGPTDLLKLLIDGREGVGGVTAVRLVTYLEFMGTKIPAPGTDGWK
jgi:hypothetical protein